MPRKSCETIWSELVYVTALLFPHIKSKIELLSLRNVLIPNSKLECQEKLIDKYFDDLVHRSDSIVNNYLQNIVPFNQEIEKIYLTGKTNKYSEIKLLNLNPETKKPFNKKYTKSDIYLKFVDGTFMGISVKSSTKDTKSNYSIEKIFKGLGIETDFKNIRFQMLKDKFGEDNYRYSREQRHEANALFYDKNNPYFQKIMETIEENKESFTEVLMQYLYPDILPYPIYEYDGLQLKNLKELHSPELVEIRRNTSYETNTSAKLWYSIYQEEKEIYKFEIRGKVDLYRGSMQVLIYNV